MPEQTTKADIFKIFIQKDLPPGGILCIIHICKL